MHTKFYICNINHQYNKTLNIRNPLNPHTFLTGLTLFLIDWLLAEKGFSIISSKTSTHNQIFKIQLESIQMNKFSSYSIFQSLKATWQISISILAIQPTSLELIKYLKRKKTDKRCSYFFYTHKFEKKKNSKMAANFIYSYCTFRESKNS